MKRQIKLAVHEGQPEMTVEAEIIGDAFGIHRHGDWYSGRPWWRVTVVVTGFAVTGPIRPKAAAIALARALLEILPAERWAKVGLRDGGVTGLSAEEEAQVQAAIREAR